MKRKAFWSFSLAGMLLLSRLATAVWSSSGQGYPDLWNRICGFSDESSFKVALPWRRLLEAINRAEDGAKREIAQKFRWFPIRRYDSKLLYPWGFEMEPKTSDSLSKEIRESLERYVKAQRMAPAEAERYKKEQSVALLSILWKHQRERNQGVRRIVNRDLGIPTRKGYDKAFATLLYDTCLLKHYVRTPSTPAFSLENLQRDWEQNGFAPLLDGMRLEGAKEDSERIRQNLKVAVRNASSHTTSRRAELLIEEVRHCLPRILRKCFEKELKNKNLTITISE